MKSIPIFFIALFIFLFSAINSFAQIEVLDNGNVGIKKDDPQKELDVNGTVKAKNYRDDNDELLINSKNGAINVTEESDGSYNLSADNNYVDIEESQGMARSAMLQPRIAMYGFNAHYGTMENDTEIYVNGILEVSVVTPSTGAISLGQGDIVTSNKPISLIHADRGAIVPPLSGHGKYHIYQTSRIAPHTVYAYAPSGKAQVEYFFNGSTTPTSTIEIEPADFGTITLPANGTHRFISTAPVILLSTTSAGNNDRTYIPPASKQVIHSFSESRHTLDSSSPITNVNNIYFTSDSPMSSTQIADGAGGDAEMGIPYAYLGDTYLLPHDVKDFAIASIDPNIIRVFAYNGNSFVLQTEYDFTSASRTAPMVQKIGTQSGNGSILYSGSPVLFTGTAPFYLRTNVNNREYSALGFLSSDRHFLTDLNAQLTEAEVDNFVANNDYISITGGADGDVLTSDGVGGVEWEAPGGNWSKIGHQGILTHLTNNNPGNVGIGEFVSGNAPIDNPQALLHVHAGSNTAPNTNILQLENDNLIALEATSNGTIRTGSTLWIGGSLQNEIGGRALYFDTGNSAFDAFIERQGSINGDLKISNLGTGEIRLGSNDLVINGDGRVDVNIAFNGNTNYDFWVQGDTRITGDLEVDGVFVNSDSRLKRDIIPLVHGLDEVLQLSPIQFYYNGKGGNTSTKLHTGILAQDLKRVMPSLTGEYTYVESDGAGNIIGKESYFNIDDSGFQWVLVNAIKEQQAIIDEQIRELKSYKDTLDALKQEMEKVEEQLQELSKAVKK